MPIILGTDHDEIVLICKSCAEPDMIELIEMPDRYVEHIKIFCNVCGKTGAPATISRAASRKAIEN